MICFMNVFEHAQLWPTSRKKFSYPPSKKVVKTTNSHLEPLPNGDARVTGPHGGIATKPFQNHSRPGSRSHIWEYYKRLKH